MKEIGSCDVSANVLKEAIGLNVKRVSTSEAHDFASYRLLF